MGFVIALNTRSLTNKKYKSYVLFINLLSFSVKDIGIRVLESQISPSLINYKNLFLYYFVLIYHKTEHFCITTNKV